MTEQLTQAQIQAMQSAANSGDRLTYWTTLAQTGDHYALMSLQVVTDSTFFGRAANRYLVAQSQLQLGSSLTLQEMDFLGVQVMQEDLQARLANINAGRSHQLSARQQIDVQKG